MTIGELLSLFPADSTVQINLFTDSGRLIYIPDPGFYQQRSKSFTSVDKLPLTSIDIEVREHEGKHFILLLLNEHSQFYQALDGIHPQFRLES